MKLSQILLFLFLIFPSNILTQQITFKNVNVTIVVIRPIKGGYDERVRVTKNLHSNVLMDVLNGRNLTIFNSLRIENQQFPIVHEKAFDGLNLMKLSIKNCDTEVIERDAFTNVAR